MGNPYVLNVQDTTGRVGIDYGVYGVPETYLINKAVVIRYKQIGPLTLKALEKTILPMVQNLNRGVQRLQPLHAICHFGGNKETFPFLK